MNQCICNTNEPSTFWNIPISHAVVVVQSLIMIFSIFPFIFYQQPLFLLLTVLQSLIISMFIRKNFCFMLGHLVCQLVGLYSFVFGFVKLITDLYSFDGQKMASVIDARLWTIWYILIIYVYYLHIVYTLVNFLWQQRQESGSVETSMLFEIE